MIKLSKFCILLLYRLLLARMYFKFCLWVLCSCAASGENQGRNHDCEVKSRIWLHTDAQLWDALVRTSPSGSIYSHWREGGSCQGWLTWGFPMHLGQWVVLPGHWHRHRPSAAGWAAPVGMASRSQGDLADTPGLITDTPGLITFVGGDCRNELSAAPCQRTPLGLLSEDHTLPLPTCLQLKPALILNPHFLAWIWQGWKGKHASMYLLVLHAPLRLY